MKEKNYKSVLSLYRTQTAIGEFKRIFERELSTALNLKRVSAPIFVDKTSGLNDDLSGTEKPVEFHAGGKDLQIVHSLAKWKRLALYEYGFHVGEGIYTDMNAIRKDEVADSTHSYYVDQWDWEKIITEKDRTIEYLKECVKNIVCTISRSHEELKKEFGEITYVFPKEVSFITAKESCIDVNKRHPESVDNARHHSIKKTSIPVRIINKNTKEEKVFSSLREACREMGWNHRNAWMVLSEKCTDHHSIKGWTIQYDNNE